jgi:hypothetical protein
MQNKNNALSWFLLVMVENRCTHEIRLMFIGWFEVAFAPSTPTIIKKKKNIDILGCDCLSVSFWSIWPHMFVVLTQSIVLV